MNPHISIVTTLYKSARFLDDFVYQCMAALAEIQCDSYEIIFVNDGSLDNSLAKVLELKQTYESIVVIDLSRNFGHHYALMAGMTYSTGDFVFLADCDLEVSPQILVTFYRKIMEGGFDVVYGVQEERTGSFIKRVPGSVFYWLFNKFTNTIIPKNRVTEQILNRKYVDSLTAMGDKNIFLAGMMIWVGYKQEPLIIIKQVREGKSTYSLKKRLLLAFEGITSFSSFPLVVLFKMGLFITMFSFLLVLYFLVKKILNPNLVMTGYTSLIVVILFSLGVIVSSLGIIGIYIDKLFNQVKERPKYVVKNIYK